MSEAELEEEGHLLARLTPRGSGRATAATGIPLLDHLLGILARYASFDLTIEIAPGGAEAQVAAAGRALGETLHEALRSEGAAGHGADAIPVDEALAAVSLDLSDRPLVVSNVDLTSVHVAGLQNDLVASFLHELAAGAGLTVHVRLHHGDDTQHVLESIFKALGSALRQACENASRQ
jgi:imidazoleglycerol-phosphate dehydratase